MELKGWGMTNLLPTCAKMADCLHYLRSVRFFHADNIDNPDLIKALEIGEKVHADLLALSGDNWISVDDRLPTKDGYHLVYDKENTVEQIVVDRFFTKINRWDNTYPSHWQPLPEPPKEQK